MKELEIGVDSAWQDMMERRDQDNIWDFNSVTKYMTILYKSRGAPLSGILYKLPSLAYCKMNGGPWSSSLAMLRNVELRNIWPAQGSRRWVKFYMC